MFSITDLTLYNHENKLTEFPHSSHKSYQMQDPTHIYIDSAHPDLQTSGWPPSGRYMYTWLVIDV
ncbi:hypothetical protein Hdeb2414_s0002g00056041 [Helianthus debilis subsp. tardiflorus]